MLPMVCYSRRPQSGQITCYFKRTYHVLPTRAFSSRCTARHFLLSCRIPSVGSQLMRTMLVVLAMYLLTMFAEAQNAPLNLMPMPANIKIGAGQLVVDPSFSV